MAGTHQSAERRRGGGGNGDPMLRYGKVLEIEPTRVVVELDREAFAALDRVSGSAGAADFLRELALTMIAQKIARKARV